MATLDKGSQIAISLPWTKFTTRKEVPMAQSAAWRGAISLAGFNVSVAAFKTNVERYGGSGLRMLDPVHQQPVKQAYVDVEGKIVDRDQTLRGVEQAHEKWLPLSPEAREAFDKASRSVVVSVHSYAKVDSIDPSIAMERYTIVPDGKVPGAESSVQTLWNGLRASNRAAIVEDWSARAGSKPSTLIIYATDEGLTGIVVPFDEELPKNLPSFTPVPNKTAAELFTKVILKGHKPVAFSLAEHPDRQGQRRQQAIDMTLAGSKGQVLSVAVQETPVQDLMAALAASLEQETAAPTVASPKRTRKPSAQVAT